MSRPARAADARDIRDLIEDFFRSAGSDNVPRQTLASIRRNIQRPVVFAQIDHDPLRYCELKLSDKRRSYRVESLFPRGLEVALLQPLLQAVLDAAGAARPDTLGWTVSAMFFRAVDADGVLDGGKSQVEAWAVPYPQLRMWEEGGVWWGEATLGELVS